MSSERDRKRQKVSQALARVPYETFRSIRKLLQDGDSSKADVKKDDWGYGKKVAQSILHSFMDCYALITFPACAGCEFSEIRAYLGKVDEILSLALQESIEFKQSFVQGPGSTGEISLIVYSDETTGGNVLQVASSKKLHLVHIHVDGVMNPLREEAWLPLMALPNRDLKFIRGGFSAVLKVIVLSLDTATVSLTIDGRRRQFTLKLKSFVGDYDALCKGFQAKSASALKPCFLCQNVLMRDSEVASVDAHFVTVASHRVRDFVPVCHEDLVATFDHMRQYVNASKAVRAHQEMMFGFGIDTGSILACPRARDRLHIDHCLFDSMHCYYSKGITSQEILLVAGILQERCGVSVESLKRSAMEVPWCTSVPAVRAPSARGMLFEPKFFEGSMYHGSATQLWYALPLFSYYVDKLTAGMDIPELQSFKALVQAAWRDREGFQ